MASTRKSYLLLLVSVFLVSNHLVSSQDQCNSPFPVIQNLPNKSEWLSTNSQAIKIRYNSIPFLCDGIVTGYKFYTNFKGGHSGPFSLGFYFYKSPREKFNYYNVSEIQYTLSKNAAFITGTLIKPVIISKNTVVMLKPQNNNPCPIMFVHNQNYSAEFIEGNCVLNQSASQTICQVKPLLELFFTPSPIPTPTIVSMVTSSHMDSSLETSTPVLPLDTNTSGKPFISNNSTHLQSDQLKSSVHPTHSLGQTSSLSNASLPVTIEDNNDATSNAVQSSLSSPSPTLEVNSVSPEPVTTSILIIIIPAATVILLILILLCILLTFGLSRRFKKGDIVTIVGSDGSYIDGIGSENPYDNIDDAKHAGLIAMEKSVADTQYSLNGNLVHHMATSSPSVPSHDNPETSPDVSSFYHTIEPEPTTPTVQKNESLFKNATQPPLPKLPIIDDDSKDEAPSDEDVYELPPDFLGPNVNYYNTVPGSQKEISAVSYNVPSTIQRRQIFANPNDWEIEGIYAVYQSVSGATGGSSNASMKNQYAKVLIPEKKSRDEFSEKWNMLPKTEERIYDEMSTSNYQELPLSIVKLKEMLARGRHGPVHKGIWQNGKELEYIAVKVLRKGASPKERVELLQEALILGRFQHPNVLKLHGVITLVEPIMVITELATEGDLKSHLLKLQDMTGSSGKKVLNYLLKFSNQIAEGMSYLEECKFTHKHLTANNILLDSFYNCKISGFGGIEKSASLKEDTEIRWMAPESLLYGKYSSSSDVWSYGMVLYEIWSLGHKPFEAMSYTQVLTLLNTGYCQPPPPGCPRDVYAIMADCWNPEHKERPHFSQLSDEFSKFSSVKNEDVENRENKLLLDTASKLGAPLEDGLRLYMDIQKKYA